MNINGFRKFLSDESWETEYEKIDRLLEEELEKDVDDIDMALVHAYTEFLNSHNPPRCG